MLDGSPIEAEKVYTGVTLKFLLEGGDDFIKAFKTSSNIDPATGQPFVPLVPQNVQDIGEQREEFKKQLNKIGTIKTEDWRPNPDKPRMVVVKL